MKSGHALVSGFARSFISGKPIPGATITALEDETFKCHTDSAGRFGPFEWPIGKQITLVFEKPGSFWSGYRTTQTATLIVPPEGINDANYLKNISFQVPSNLACKVLSWAMGITEDPQSGQIAATITPPNTTMDDIPQGVAEVKATLSPNVKSKTFYFGIFPIFHKTNPLIRTLESTSLDGGVGFFNVPEGEYTLEAKKNGVTFSTVRVKARKGVLVNASPPYGPIMQQDSKLNEVEKKPNHFNFFRPAVAIGLATAGVCLAGAVLSRSP
jgi:hypothetical protein